MESKDLILVDENVYLKKRGSRGQGLKKLALRLFALLIVGFLVACAIYFLPSVREKIITFVKGTVSLPEKPPSGTLGENEGGTENGEGENEDNEESPGNIETIIPSGAHEIKSVRTEYSVLNEAEISLELDMMSLPLPSEIIKRYGSEAPVVLVTHLYGNECYSNGKYYTEGDDFYADTQNIAALATELTKKLNSLGIKAVYLEGEYAKGSVYGAREEYENALAKMISRYPSISYVFSLSRGIYVNDDMTQDSEKISLNGENCAQIRMISGTSGEKTNASQEKNVAFALDFARFANEKIENFVSQSIISRFPLSQNVSPFTVEFELGTYASTYSEAKNSTELLSQLIFEYFASQSAVK